MNRSAVIFGLIAFFFIAGTFLFPQSVSASGDGVAYETEVNGYRIFLTFLGEVKTGNNTAHIQIINSEGLIVTPSQIGVVVLDSIETKHSEAESHGDIEPINEHDGMAGMDVVPTSEPADLHDSNSHDELAMITLEHEAGHGEYVGIVNFDKAGERELIVHFVVDDQPFEAKFSINIVQIISKNSVLAVFFIVNVFMIGLAATLKNRNITRRKEITS